MVALVVEVDATSEMAAEARDALAISRAIAATRKIAARGMRLLLPRCPLFCRILRLEVFSVRISTLSIGTAPPMALTIPSASASVDIQNRASKKLACLSQFARSHTIDRGQLL